MILAFVGWLISARKVSSASISQYMSGLRTVHLKHGVMPGNLRPDIVTAIIRGRGNDEAVLKRKIPRLAMTTPVMRLLKALLTRSKMLHARKRLIWSIGTIALAGSFRIHELLSRETASYDPTSTLLGCDIRLQEVTVDGEKEQVLVVNLKAPKEDKLGQGVKVELFATGTFSCPLSAWLKWRRVARVPLCPTKPVFRASDGSCMTGNLFNRDIKSLLGKVIDYDEKRYLSHSFRWKECLSV
jgi:hypothetical protein